MKKGFIFFVALLLFVFFAAVTASAKEERESQKITVRSHDINNGVVILVAREGTNSFELHCNKEMSGCTPLEPGEYLMVRLPKDWGMYDCANVDLYRKSGDLEAGDKLGEYCLIEAR